MQRVQHGEEEDARRGDRGRDVAEHVDLGAARALRPVAQPQRHAAGLERGAHRAPHVDRRARGAPALLVAERREAPLQLRDRAVHRGEVLGRAGRQCPIELGERPRRRQLLGPLDQRPLELTPQVALELLDLLAVDRSPLLVGVAGRRPGGRGCGGSAARRRRPRPSPRPGARRRRSRAARGRASRRRCPRRSPGGSPRAARRGRAARRPRNGAARRAALERLGLGGAEEEAVEEQLEDAAVLLRLRDRRRERLAEVVRLAPGNGFERRERVEDLRGPDARRPRRGARRRTRRCRGREPPRGLPSAAASSQPPRPRPPSFKPRPARRPGRCRCGA